MTSTRSTHHDGSLFVVLPDARLKALRETGRGKRVRHSLGGMGIAWFLTQCVVMVIMAVFGFWKFKAFAYFSGISAIVCLSAWLVLGLPCYWFLSRKEDAWNPLIVTVIGGVGGGFIPLLLEFPHFLVIAITAGIGAVSAIGAWFLEERLLRKLVFEEQRALFAKLG